MIIYLIYWVDAQSLLLLKTYELLYYYLWSVTLLDASNKLAQLVAHYEQYVSIFIYMCVNVVSPHLRFFLYSTRVNNHHKFMTGANLAICLNTWFPLTSGCCIIAEILKRHETLRINLFILKTLLKTHIKYLFINKSLFVEPD